MTGLAAAVSVPLDRPGLGWAAAAVVAVGCAVVAAVRTAAPRPGPARIGWALVALALLGAGTIRAAGWLFVLCVLTAAVAGVAGGGRRAQPGRSGRRRGRVAGRRPAGAALGGARASARWAERGCVPGPRHRGHRRTAAGLRLAVRLRRRRVRTAVLRGYAGSATGHGGRRSAFLFVVGTLGPARRRLPGRPAAGSGRARDARAAAGCGRLEWGLPVIALNLLFAAFVAVQFTVLFGGAATCSAPDGPDFAEYARRRLLAAAGRHRADPRRARRGGPVGATGRRRRDRVLIRVLLGALAASDAWSSSPRALYRMHVYEQAYGFTRLRVLVSAFELWLGAVFVLVLAAGVRLRAAGCPARRPASAVGRAARPGRAQPRPVHRRPQRRPVRRHRPDRRRLPVRAVGRRGTGARPAAGRAARLRAAPDRRRPVARSRTTGANGTWPGRAPARSSPPTRSSVPPDCPTRSWRD